MTSAQLSHRMSEVKIYCDKWNLKNPTHFVSTSTSDIFRVIYDSDVAVLKLFNGKGHESSGAKVLSCFNGNGAVRILDSDESAHLLEFVEGPSLKSIVEKCHDDQATEVLCDVFAKLHSYMGPHPDNLISMEENFGPLLEKAKASDVDPIYRRGAQVVAELINSACDVRVLHGDIHHENVLEHSARGWISIDPKGLVGERTYDLANSFYNPKGFTELALSQKRILDLCNKFSKKLNIDRARILKYAFAYGCLSASWFIEDGENPEETLRIARSIENLLRVLENK